MVSIAEVEFVNVCIGCETRDTFGMAIVILNFHFTQLSFSSSVICLHFYTKDIRLELKIKSNLYNAVCHRIMQE